VTDRSPRDWYATSCPCGRLAGEEPERARGLNVDTLWADELAGWQRAQSTWDLIMLALRAGANPQALITTTPRRVRA
jgi:phage terminase large subunit-like protein